MMMATTTANAVPSNALAAADAAALTPSPPPSSDRDSNDDGHIDVKEVKATEATVIAVIVDPDRSLRDVDQHDDGDSKGGPSPSSSFDPRGDSIEGGTGDDTVSMKIDEEGTPKRSVKDDGKGNNNDSNAIPSNAPAANAAPAPASSPPQVTPDSNGDDAQRNKGCDICPRRRSLLPPNGLSCSINK